MAQWLNYKELKAEISFIDVLEHYGVEMKIKGEQATCPCPLPSHDGDSTSPSFSANLDRNIFQCFGCGAKGNILDFLCLMGDKNPKDAKQFHQVAVMAKRCCQMANRCTQLLLWWLRGCHGVPLTRCLNRSDDTW